ncbi:hypothetical protein SUGI_0873200 [Cryptomeria japonica]|nr:hypothetical protein SUGI_0873200 [Cryptomeria japonica]
MGVGEHLLNLVSGKSGLTEESWDKRGHLIQRELWMIHSGRVMLCVVMAYLLPSMAARESQEFWGKMSALGITILGHMTTELYSVHKNTESDLITFFSLWPSKDSSNEVAFIGSTVILSLSFLTLILLLGCANLASRGIQVIFAQNIPLILKDGVEEKKDGDEKKREDESIDDVEKKWETIEAEVLKAWIVARAYTPENIIAKSPLSSGATTIVSLLIWTSILGWLKQCPFVRPSGVDDTLKLIITILQVIFILIGLAIMAWRWAIAAWFYTRWSSVSWRRVLRVEDYWTRHIKDLIEDRSPKLQPAKKLCKKVTKLVAKQPRKNQIPKTLLKVLELLQCIMVLFSKICWVLPLIIFYNKWTSKLPKTIISKHQEHELEKFSEYKEILKGLGMLGETPQSLWIANKKSIAKARRLITKGNHSREANCKELVTFLQKGKRPKGIDLMSSFDLKEPPKFEYLWTSDKYKPLQVEKQFVDVTKTSWKMTAVCLIRMIIQLSPICDSSDCSGFSHATSHGFPPKDVKDSLETYFKHGILGEAADKFFLTLKTEVKKGDLPPKRMFHSKPECVAKAMNELADEGKEKADGPRGLNIVEAMLDDFGPEGKKKKQIAEQEDPDSVGAYDSMNWKTVAAGTALYKLCKSIGGNPNATELFEELQCALAEIILGSIRKAESTLVSKSRKWATDSDEMKIAGALYTAGKAKTVVKMVKRKKAEQQKRDVRCLEIATPRSEKRETNPADPHCVEIVTSTS